MLYRIDFCGRSCTITIPIALEQHWRAYLEPFGSLSYATAPECWHVQVELRPQHVAAMIRSSDDAEPCVLHGELSGRQIRHAPTLISVVVPALRTVYQLETRPGQLCLRYLCAELCEASLLDLFRLVRGLLVGLLEADGLRKVHLSAIASGGAAVAFIGAEGAGKTSFMLAALRALDDAALITNDKGLMAAPDSAVHVYGLPYAVSIGPGALSCCPEIPVDDATRVLYGEAYFWPGELAGYLGRPVHADGTLSAIFDLQLDLSSTTISCSEIQSEREKARAFQANLFAFSDKITPTWLLDMLGIRPAIGEGLDAALLRLPLYRLTGNPWAEQRPLAQLIDSARRGAATPANRNG